MVNKTLPVLVSFIFILSVYAFSIGNDPILGDGLVFTVQAYKGFDIATNATSHFLYFNFLALSHRAFPFINPHYLFVCISLAFSIGSLFVIRNFLLLFGISNRVSNRMVLLLAFSFTYWRISIITEVYAFYMFFVSSFFFVSFSFIKNKGKSGFVNLSLLLGILLLIHIQSILLLPFYIFMAYENLRNNTKQIIWGLCLFVTIASVLFIPVFLHKHNALAILNDNAYADSLFNFTPITLLKSFLKNAAFLIYNFLFFLIFTFWGTKNLRFKKYILLIVIPFLIFIIKHNVSDSYVFHLVPYIFLLIVIGLGVESKLPRLSIISILTLPLIYFASYRLIDNVFVGKKINAETGFKGGVRYYFFPPINGNPGIDNFVKSYQQGNLKDIRSFDVQYGFAIEWQRIKNKYHAKIVE